jgi:hypothetical protein
MTDDIQQNISRFAFKHGITLGHLNETGGRELECVLERFDAQAAEIKLLRARIDRNAIEYDRLLSRCAALEHVRQQAQALIDYEDAGPDDPAGKSWMHYWGEKFEALRAALKAAPQ